MLNIYLVLLFFSLRLSVLHSENIKEKHFSLAKNHIPESRLLIDKEKKKIIEKKEEIKNKKVIQKISKEKKKEVQTKEFKEEYIKNQIIINFASESEEPNIDEIKFFYKNLPNFNKKDRITIIGYAKKGINDSSSKARRLSLKRALYFRSLFLEENYAITDIYIRALGDKSNIQGNKDIVIITND